MEAEQARQRLELLARLSGVLATSVDYPAALREISSVLLPMVGDLLLVDLRDGEELAPRVSAHTDQLLAQRLQAVRLLPRTLPRGHPIAEVCRTGEPLLVAQVSDAWLDAFAGSRRRRWCGGRSGSCRW